MGFEVLPNKTTCVDHTESFINYNYIVADTKNVTWPQHYIVQIYCYNQMIHNH